LVQCGFALSGQTGDGRDAQRAGIQQRLAALSRQERQVLQSLVDGRLNSSIAHDLGLNVRLVKVHRANVMAKMQATSLAHLVRMMLLVAT
jgi:two-component system response regulator FixJ